MTLHAFTNSLVRAHCRESSSHKTVAICRTYVAERRFKWHVTFCDRSFETL